MALPVNVPIRCRGARLTESGVVNQKPYAGTPYLHVFKKGNDYTIMDGYAGVHLETTKLNQQANKLQEHAAAFLSEEDDTIFLPLMVGCNKNLALAF